MKPGVTVVICTFNGAALLPETIRHITQQRVESNIPWEVIVIDNASTDDTSQVARQEWHKYRNTVPFSVLYQPRQGLTFAREMAIEEANYEYVLFCDDDNWLNTEYVDTAYHLMLQHPNIGVLGGHGELVYEVPPPSWAQTLPMFGNGPQETRSGKVKRNIVYGAGSILRRSAFLRLFKAGYKPFLTDRNANSLSSGGDSELCYAIALANFDIWYDDRLRFKHFMPKARITWSYYTRFFKERAQCFDVLIPYSILINFGSRNTLSFSLRLMRLFLFTLRQIMPLYLNLLLLRKGSEADKVNRLKLMASEARLLSYRRCFNMLRNFLEILRFQQKELPAQTERSPQHQKKKLKLGVS